MMFIAHCGISFDSPENRELPPPGVRRRSLEVQDGDGGRLPNPDSTQEPNWQQKLTEKEEQYKTEIRRLEQTIANLQQQVKEVREAAADKLSENPAENEHYKVQSEFYEKHFKGKLNEAEINSGVALNNEYELIPFCRFTMTRLYLVDPGLGKRVVEKPIGYKKKDITEAVSMAIEKLNLGRTDGDYLFSQDDFLEGIYRTVPVVGTQYELFFRDVDYDASPTRYKKINMFRAYGPLEMVVSEEVYTRKDTVNLILPLSGRLEKFRQFMERFAKVCIRIDKRVYLTVVYFGSSGLNEVKSIIGSVSKTYRFRNIKLLTLNEEFSRGRGLQIGAQSWTQGDVILFLCDVDIVFSTDFLERCRLNAKQGERVYYPIVFSLYNPKVVYSLQDIEIPSESEQLIISKDTGFWRDFGYGMTCQYRSDFFHMKGFDENIHGWGLEDVYLYRKYVKSDLMVIRATDPGIFHLWHEKLCDPKLQPDQYRGCIRSKALNEASHAQLGMLAFKEEISEHLAVMKNTSWRTAR